MSNKRFLKIVFGLSILGTLFIAGVNYVVDPYQQYRVETFYPIEFTNQRYKNAGFAKNYKYDSIILGTSMTENFVIDEIEEKLNFNKVIKLSISGGSAREQSTTLNTSIENNKDLKNILWGLDIFAFIGEPDMLRYGINSFPFYLYDDNILNDYKYLFSIDIFINSIKTIVKPYLKHDEYLYDYNRMYQWQHLTEKEFSKKYIIKSWIERERFLNHEKNRQSYNYFKNSFDINFLDLIKNNPQISFKIFFPPYSILTFKTFEERNQINDIINFKKYIYQMLIELKNVQIYDFQSEVEITHNLNFYKDLSHYHQNINSWMIDMIKENRYLVTKENIDAHLENLRKQIKEYDLDKL